jgi:hypothetical protein
VGAVLCGTAQPAIAETAAAIKQYFLVMALLLKNSATAEACQ